MKIVRSSKIDTVFVLVIFCVLAISVLIVLTLAGSIYKNTVNITRENNSEQMGLSFIWTKIKNGDSIEKIYVSEFHDVSALCIEEEFDGIEYQTMIYMYDGWIRELFFAKGLEFSPQDGIPIIEAVSLEIEMPASGLIEVTIGGESLFISPRCKPDIPRQYS